MSISMKTIFLFNFLVLAVFSSGDKIATFRKYNSSFWDERRIRPMSNGRRISLKSNSLMTSQPEAKIYSNQYHVLRPHQHIPAKIPRVMDLPLKRDLSLYLKSLQRIIGQVEPRYSNMDLNMLFGLFLTQVNLKWTLYYGVKIEKTLKTFLNKLSNENENKIKLLHDKILKYKGVPEDKNKKISSLFDDWSAWVYRIKRFNSTYWTPQHSIQTFASKNYTWRRYEMDIQDVNKFIPTPSSSDKCINSLTHVSQERDSDRCANTLQECDNMILFGTELGYALTHRLLYLLIARYKHGCDASPDKVHSPATLCMKIYPETLFIAKNNYKNVDLILEQSTLCSLEGYAAFLRRSYLRKVLEFQTPFGCFGMQPYREQDIYNRKGGICNGHVTAVAAGTISAAIRFIIQAHYS